MPQVRYVDCVQAFANAMESQFTRNSHKGDGSEDEIRQLRPILDLAYEKLETLKTVIRSGAGTHKVTTEAADLANLALMASEIYRRRYPNV